MIRRMREGVDVLSLREVSGKERFAVLFPSRLAFDEGVSIDTIAARESVGILNIGKQRLTSLQDGFQQRVRGGRIGDSGWVYNDYHQLFFGSVDGVLSYLRIHHPEAYLLPARRY